ncbi:TonB-dependent receptor [Sphingomonas oleivorans]|uniref:TonB-dependent receptor n=1 Tax=Sphingomonas oleivorans TaxID=1735121 RepID=A0A2T5G2J2_9SPHN|nr:TonB-dependent receptor [Sphingomonas oleivorans]PTQ13373.1 TonB-dependent receptor [Sphingomonas oleivorans]
MIRFSPAALSLIAVPVLAQSQTPEATGQGEIIVTATKRSEALSSVPLAVSAVSGEALQLSGASDTRGLVQLSPSLLLSSSSTEAAGGAARIRGIGTVGDNAGLESSVATFVDGVYRARSGVALTELGAVERIEVARGPQGTLFGRNASAGLIQVITARPKFEEEGTAEASYGNYDYRRFQLGLTGPLVTGVAYRIDGTYVKRDGFVRDVVSGRDINDRDRWLLRGQLLFDQGGPLTARIIADYAERDEECCAAPYQPTRNIRRNADGTLAVSPSSIAALERQLGGIVVEDPDSRRAAVTPGRSFRSDVRDRGISGQVDYDLGDATLTSISAWRDWRWLRGQDGDFTGLDILARPDDGSAGVRFHTFSQEVRMQGEAGPVDWLVGGYFADERLNYADNLQYGADYGRYTACLTANGLGGLSPASPGCLSPATRASLASSASGATLLAGLDRLAGITSAGAGSDRYVQRSRNWALFTHNVVTLTDRLNLTLGLRYTNERKRLSASLNGSPAAASTCATNAAQLAALRDDPAQPAAIRTAAGTIISLGCVVAPITSATLADRRGEDELTGTAILSYRPVERLLTYASYARGYKAGGFNLDRAALTPAAPSARSLRFAAEKVDALEIGAKFNGRRFDLNVAAFYQRFDDFQLNIFSGANFIVENIEGCGALAGGPGSDSDNIGGNSACVGEKKPGVTSRGVEVEAYLRPAPDLSVNIGYTLADTRYAKDLAGVGGRAIGAALFQLPGRGLSNAPLHTVTGSFGWTPPIGSGGLSGLLYADMRYQSRINTGSDLDLEKEQQGVATVNARIGVRHADAGWSLEFWANNLFDTLYKQVAFDAPVQPGGAFNTARGVAQGYQATGTQLYGAFLAEPRTYGVTARTRF